MPWDTQLDPTSNTRLQQELTLLVQGTTITLSSKGGISDAGEFWLIAGSGVLNVLSALLAL